MGLKGVRERRREKKSCIKFQEKWRKGAPELSTA